MSSRTLQFLASITCCVALTAPLTGCGGGNNGQAASQTRTGRVQLNISWPARNAPRSTSRYIPTYAASLYFELYPKGNPNQRYKLTANRPSDKPSTQQVTFQDLLPTGTYELAGQANALPDGQGAAVASGALEIQVKSGMNPVALTLNSTIKSLLVLGQPLTIAVSQSLTLQSGAFDPNGAGLLLPDGALTWSIVSGSQFGSITPGGKLTATAVGTIRVQVQEPVTKVLAVADVTVSAQGSTTGLAQSGYPKPGADLGSTGLVTGSGATGAIAWTFDLGSRGVGTPVLGKSNLLFAVSQSGIIYALDATTGAKKWQATLPNLLGAVTVGSLVVADDNTVMVGYDQGIQAYDSATGLPKWTNTDYSVTANMTLTGGKLYVPSRNQGVGVVDERTGVTLTSYPGLTVSYDVAITNGIIYYATEQVGAGRAAKIYAINISTGATVWSKDITIQSGGGYGGSYPVINSDGTVYLGLGDGNLDAFDGMTGSMTGTQVAFITPGSLQPCIGMDKSVYFTQRNTVTNVFETVRYAAGLNQKVWGSPFVFKEPTVGTDGTVYGAGNDLDANGNQTGATAVYALNGADGTKKWKVVLDRGHPAAPPGFGQVPGYTAVAPNGMIYVVSIDQLVYAIQ